MKLENMVKLLKTDFVNLKLKAPSLSDCLEIESLCVEDLVFKGSLKNVGNGLKETFLKESPPKLITHDRK